MARKRNAERTAIVEAMGKSQAIIEFELDGTIVDANENFLDAIVGKEHPPLISAHEAALRSDVMEALYRAAQTSSWQSPQYR